jgi:hypothetical protein
METIEVRYKPVIIGGINTGTFHKCIPPAFSSGKGVTEMFGVAIRGVKRQRGLLLGIVMLWLLAVPTKAVGGEVVSVSNELIIYPNFSRIVLRGLKTPLSIV